MKEEKNIEEFIEEYTEVLRAVCRKYYLVGGNEDDLFQEGLIGFLQAVKNFDKSKGDYESESFKKFALMCAKRRILDAIKKHNAQKHQPLNTYISIEGALENIDISSDKVINPEELYIAKEQATETINKIKNSLSSFENNVFKLYLEGKTQSKIAEILNKDVKSIDNTIQRIKAKVREQV